MNSLYKSKTRSGFTLIEIMTATAIMLVVIVVVLQLTANVLTSFTRVSGKMERSYQAQQALDMIAKDLSGAIFHSDNNAWMHIVDESKKLKCVENADTLYFFATPSSMPKMKNPGHGGDKRNELLGDVAAVCYKITRQNLFKLKNKDKGEMSFALYRGVVRSDTTFNDMLGDSNGITETRVDEAWNQPLELLDANYNEIKMNGIKWVTQPYNMIAQNVVDFDVMVTGLYNTSEGKLINLADSKVGKKISPGNSSKNYKKMYSKAKREAVFPVPKSMAESASKNAEVGVGYLPVWIDVSIVVLSDKGDDIMRADASNGLLDKKRLNEIKKEYGTSYRRRIKIDATQL